MSNPKAASQVSLLPLVATGLVTFFALSLAISLTLTLAGCSRDPANRVHAPRCSRAAAKALDVSEDSTRDHVGERCNVILTNTDTREILVERGRLLHHPVAGAVGTDDSWQGFLRVTLAPGKTHRLGQACSEGKYLVIAGFKHDLFDPDTGDETQCHADFEELSFKLREQLCVGEQKLKRARSDEGQDYNCTK